MALTQVSDIVVPEHFDPYMVQKTEEKSALIQAGVLVRNPLIDQKLDGGGQTFTIPSHQDLASTEENTSGDAAADVQTLAAGAGTTLAAQNDARPLKTATSSEVLVRLERNQHWSGADLAADLAGSDPLDKILDRVATYWSIRLQQAFVQTVTGIIADNTANDSGDFTNDIKGASFVDGVTNFNTEALMNTKATMGDSGSDLSVLMVHSVVKTRMQINDLIDTIKDSEGRNISMFQDLQVIEDDMMPAASGVYESWLFGRGAAPYGTGAPKGLVPIETSRQPLAGGGGGQDILSTRVAWAIHLIGLAYVGTGFADGGPNNTTGTAPLNAAASWNRVYPQRKQIKFARLVTRESA